MKTLKTLAVAATLIAGMSAAYASPFNSMGGVAGLERLSDANSATVLSVNQGDVPFLRSMTDTAALQARITANPALAKTVRDQGYDISEIIGLDANNPSSVTLYAL